MMDICDPDEAPLPLLTVDDVAQEFENETESLMLATPDHVVSQWLKYTSVTERCSINFAGREFKHPSAALYLRYLIVSTTYLKEKRPENMNERRINVVMIFMYMMRQEKVRQPLFDKVPFLIQFLQGKHWGYFDFEDGSLAFQSRSFVRDILEDASLIHEIDAFLGSLSCAYECNAAIKEEVARLDSLCFSVMYQQTAEMANQHLVEETRSMLKTLGAISTCKRRRIGPLLQKKIGSLILGYFVFTGIGARNVTMTADTVESVIRTDSTHITEVMPTPLRKVFCLFNELSLKHMVQVNRALTSLE